MALEGAKGAPDEKQVAPPIDGDADACPNPPPPPPKQQSRWKAPRRAIFNPTDMGAFTHSTTYTEIVQFVRVCNEAVKGKMIGATQGGATYAISPVVKKICALMDDMSKWVDEIPPLQQPMRFGNRAFCAWHERLVKEAPTMIKSLLPEHLQGAAVELVPYLTTSFGNETRIDYGTGHETNFVVWLCCLYKLGIFQREDLTAVVLQAFNAYLKLMRRLQTIYVLEPAGSHGVWGLDDYHCLPFYWGSAQMDGGGGGEQSPRTHAAHDISPSAIHDEAVLSEYEEESLYFGAIAFIKSLKVGAPFAEACPMLNDISAMPTWAKVNSGMLRLYEGEVLKKLPVIQHFLFGTLLPCTWTPSRQEGYSAPLARAVAAGGAAANIPGPHGQPHTAHTPMGPAQAEAGAGAGPADPGFVHTKAPWAVHK